MSFTINFPSPSMRSVSVKKSAKKPTASFAGGGNWLFSEKTQQAFTSMHGGLHQQDRLIKTSAQQAGRSATFMGAALGEKPFYPLSHWEKIDRLVEEASDWWMKKFAKPDDKSTQNLLNDPETKEKLLRFQEVLKSQVDQEINNQLRLKRRSTALSVNHYKPDEMLQRALDRANFKVFMFDLPLETRMSISLEEGKIYAGGTAGDGVKLVYSLPKNPLITAIKQDDAPEKVKTLLKTNPVLIQDLSLNGVTPLMIAAGLGKHESLQALLENNANVNAVDLHGQTALAYAASGGHIQILDKLLKAGAQIDPPVKKRGVPSPLMNAATNGKTDAVKFLLENGAEANYHDGDILHYRGVDLVLRSPLTAAAANGRQETVQFLLESGKLDVKQLGPAAVHCSEEEHPKIAEMIKNHPDYPKDEPVKKTTFFKFD